MQFRRNVSVLAATLFLVLTLLPYKASAQQAGSGLQLSPTRSEITANPGEQKSFTISLKNITQSKLTTKAVLNDFESDNVTGTPKILVDSRQRTAYSISSMLLGLNNVELKPGETKEIKLNIDVPGNAAPGAYFGAVRYSVIPSADTPNDRQIALNASVAQLVFVEVPGNVVQQIKVNSLKFKKGEKTKKFFFTQSADKAELSIKNMGNGFARPFGKVTIKNPLGKQAATYDVNNRDPRSIVLPNSSRVFTNDISNTKIPGRYTATASVAYGNGGEVVNFKSSFWYLPIWFLAIILILLVALGLAIYYIYRKRFSGKSAKKHRG